jgi:ATP-dependent Lhr-like helicase
MVKTVSSYFSLHPLLQRNIVSRLGWRSLRPVQELAIPPLLQGQDAIILAPTAGGKTESAMFPLLSNLASEARGSGPHLLYLCPLKALINNLLNRLSQLGGLVGREAFSWHGEVSSAQRKRFLESPESILLTTPESLQVLLSRRQINPSKLFGALQAVVVDEIHAFCGTARGDQLSALLTQLDYWKGSAVQRVGLSATVGNPLELLQWLSGDRERESTLIDPSLEGPKQPKLLEVHPIGSKVEECSPLTAALMKGSAKNLLFVDSRRQAEAMQARLCERGIEAQCHHSSLSQDLREKAEETFRCSSQHARKPQAIVCTSTLELGLDVGDIDKVFQLGAPSTVSAFLQRLGRAGRRADSVAHMIFVTDREQGFLQALALIQLAIQKRVEPVVPKTRSFTVLVQQILLNLLRAGGLRPGQLWKILGPAAPFSAISSQERERVLSHLLAQRWLLLADGRLSLGPRYEQEFGRSHSMELLSVFNGSSSVKVQTEARVIGTINFGTADGLARSGKSFLLGGSSWKARRLDKMSQTLLVTPSTGGEPIRWSGRSRELSATIVRTCRDILTGDQPLPFLSRRANLRLSELRADYRELNEAPQYWCSQGSQGIHFQVEQWAGARVHRTLAAAIAGWLGTDYRCDARTWTVEASPDQVLPLIDEAQKGRWHDFCLGGLECYRGRHQNSAEEEKFAHLLPPEFQEETAREAFYEVEGSATFWEELSSLVPKRPSCQSSPSGGTSPTGFAQCPSTC